MTNTLKYPGLSMLHASYQITMTPPFGGIWTSLNSNRSSTELVKKAREVLDDAGLKGAPLEFSRDARNLIE
jgi:hypothetical protein